MADTCGDYGGTTKSDVPCDRPAGWGIEGETTGKCNQHRESLAVEKKEQNADDTGSKDTADKTNTANEGLGCLWVILLVIGAPYIIAIGLALLIIFAVPLVAISLMAIPALIIFSMLDA